MLEVLENYVTHPRARVDAAERMARLIRVVKPISAKPVKCAPWTPESVLWSSSAAVWTSAMYACFQADALLVLGTRCWMLAASSIQHKQCGYTPG